MRRRTLPTLKGRGIEAAADPRDVLPPGWIRVESRSKPGSFYYAHPATKRTQLERPVDPRYAQREKPKAVVEPQPAPVQDPVTVDDDVETLEEKQRREEERKAEQKAREEAEEKEREEVLLRARQRRAQQMLEEEKRRKEEEEQEEEERQRAAERRREKKAEAERLRKEMEEKAEKEAKEAPKPVAAASAALGRRDAAKEAQGKRRKKADSDEDADSGEEEITLEELEKWKASEEQHEREEAEAKRRKIEEEERRKAEAELAEKRKKAEFEEAVARARRMKSESSFHKQEELRRGPNANGQEPEPAKAEPTKAASSSSAEAEPAKAEPAKAEPTKMAVPPPQALTQTQPPQIFPPPPQIQPNAQFPFQFPAMQAQVPRPPSPPPPPPPTPPTLANLLSGAVAKPDFGKLLKQPKAPVEEDPSTGPQTGTVLWYNGRRKSGVILTDRDSRRLRIPSHAATMGGVAPPVPAGLMHGTRVNFMLDTSAPGDPTCVQVRPLPNQVGLSCGGDSQAGQKLVNEDRTIATDLQESLGHMVGIFDGHRGTYCADYLSQELPKTIVQHVRELVNQEAMRRGAAPGAPWEPLTEAEEVDAIRMGIIAGLEATDRNFLGLAQQYGFKDGAAAVVAIIMHGFQSSSSSVPAAPGGQARLFAAWSGTGHILLLRGRQVLRCTEDHVVNREDEQRRLAGLGANLVQDLRGLWWMGRPGNPELAWARQQCYDDVAGPKTFMAASRGFGDIMLKGPPYPVLAAAPEVQVTDLCPDDWAIVLATRGVFSVLSDQDVANACWDAMAQNGQGPQEAAQIVTQRALQLGARSNLTCIVMRLGWAKLPS